MASILFEEDALKPIRRKQLLNNIVDGLAKVRPGTIYAEVPRSSISYEFGYRKISYANFANAINGLAQWLHDTLGPAENFPTLAYIGPNDFRYNALMLAAVKAGYKAGGIFMTLLNAVFNQIPLIYPLSGVPLSTKIVLEALNHVKADSVLLAPPLVDEVGANPEMLNFLVKNIDVLLYGGGDVSQATGDKISKRLKLSMIIGSTESGAYPAVFPTDKWPSDDWKCLHFHPNAGIELRPHSENRYEAVLIRNSDPEKVQPIFSVFPSLNEWETHDLYAPHPSIPDLWLCSGRSDDIIMSHHPEVRAALVIGAHRFQTALLIELVSLQALSTVERAKAIELAKSHVFFTSPDKPMGISGKGMVQRQPTLDLYAKEIDNPYADADIILTSNPLDISTLDIEKCEIDIIDKSLTTAIIQLSSLHESAKSSSDKSRQQGIHDSLVEYKTIIDEIAPSDNQTYSNGIKDVNGTSSREKVVILTGSTGALGSYILQTLLSSSTVSHIFCLNRTAGEQPQIKRSEAHGLPTEFPSDRVTFLQVNLSEKRLGLEPETFERIKPPQCMASTASQDPSLMFLSSLSSVGNFSGDVPESVINDITASLPMGYSESKFIAENLLSYATDKFPRVSISIARVGQIAGPVSTTGIWTKHEWFPSLVLSSIHLGIMPESLDSTDRSKVDWIPIDLIADILVELIFSQRIDHNNGAKVYYPVNPVLVPWKSFLPKIIKTATVGQENKITPVPFAKWIELVRKDAEDLHSKIDFEEMLGKNPAIKLLSFYEGLAKGRVTSVMENKKAVQESEKLRGLKGIEGSWVEKWVQSWIE
ncbi:thioester reductase domain-containing protein [Botrytis cinerea]